MSCTENESGPFVVFFLPAVVGCLTILLARRWANSQVSNTSSTAVSRRRKIIKDPLIKRPLPPIACKMVATGSKKASGVSKKGYQIPEEEINGSGKRVRVTRIAPASNLLSDVKLSDGPAPPKHIPFPYIPQDGELLFEAMTFIFTVVATGLQFLNLYRTAWWLPNSYVNEAMHFHLIDGKVVAFIALVLARRLVLSAARQALHAFWPDGAPAPLRTLIAGLGGGALIWLTYAALQKYPFIKIFYLVYPVIIYLLLFGFDSSPLMELNSSSLPLHGCSHDPHAIRAEVEVLRQDFNLRLNKILFNSVVGAYYSSFIPCCFAPSYLYYDVYGAAQQTALVWAGLAGRYGSQLLSAAYLDVPHRAALHLGRWYPESGTAVSDPDPPPAWCAARVYSAGARVCAGAVWRAHAHTAAAPRDTAHARFHTVFINPSMLLCILLCLQLTLVVLQLCLLFSGTPWHHFLSIVVLLFINYYTLFKMVRDYLVAWKVYKAEHMIQDKNGLTISN